jgi:diguanylate cyclase (GGDEF)-like protein/PAS domain S-box-containing protein
MSVDLLIVLLIAALVAIIVAGVTGWIILRRQKSRVAKLYDEMIEVSGDAVMGRRLAERGTGELLPLVSSINKLFDALGERDEQIQDIDDLVSDFARTLPEIVLVHDEQILIANDSAAALVGLDPAQLVGRQAADLVKPAYRALFKKTTAKHLEGSEAPNRLELQLINGNDRGLWVEVQSSRIEFRGKPAVMTIARDVSYRKNLEVSLGRSKRQAQYTLESISEGVITTDNKGVIDYMNGAAEKLTGSSRETAIGKKSSELFTLVDEADRRPLGDPVERCLAMRRRVNMGRKSLLISKSDQEEHSAEVTASPIRGPGNEISGTVVVLHDVSEIRGLTRQMSYQATHDALTGLINRREFERRLEEAISNARAEGTTHILCYMDLDRFKAVNDSSGHIAGDNMLREVAALLREKVRDSDYVARLGGDEFGMLLVGCPLEKARQIATSVCNAVGDYRFVWQDKIFNIGISIGLVEITRDAGEMQDLVSAADSACYVAKQRGRGQVHVYSARDEALARERGDIQWLREIQTALNQNGFDIVTQPIIALGGKNGSGPSTEVFLRLPDGGKHAPNADFLRPAERYQLMPQIDRWVVQATLAAISRGDIKLAERRSCTINLSGQTLGDEGFLEFVVDALDRSGVQPSSICFEVGEAEITENLSTAMRFIEVLHGIGCQFSMDDFGSGLGAFSNLKQLPLDFVKVDGTFTRNLTSDQINQEMVSALINLARRLEFKVIAEQVEEQEDFDWLRDVDVDYVQGNFIEKPSMLGKPASPARRM